jgi:hypothetical protein
VGCALAELWERGNDAGLSSGDIQAIADRYVEWDDQENPWPRPLATNIVPLRR